MYGVYIRYISYVESKYTVSANPKYLEDEGKEMKNCIANDRDATL